MVISAALFRRPEPLCNFFTIMIMMMIAVTVSAQKEFFLCVRMDPQMSNLIVAIW